MQARLAPLPTAGVVYCYLRYADKAPVANNPLFHARMRAPFGERTRVRESIVSETTAPIEKLNPDPQHSRSCKRLINATFTELQYTCRHLTAC